MSAYIDYFPKFGINATFITRHWSGNEQVWADYESSNTNRATIENQGPHKIVRLPYSKPQFYEHAKNTSLPGRRLALLICSLFGSLQPEYRIGRDFESFLDRHLTQERYDYVLATPAPLGTLRLASKISNKYNIPLIVDFRDMWNLAAFSSETRGLPLRLKALNLIQEFYIRRWLRPAVLVSAVNETLLKEIRRLAPANVKGVVVRNGYEEGLFRNRKTTDRKAFTFSVIGTLYEFQDLEIMISGLSEFIKDKEENDVELKFIGCAVNRNIEKILRASLPDKIIQITPRISHDEALGMMRDSHVLFYPAWRGFKGVTSGKIYEYLASGRNILVAPGDKDTIDQLLSHSGSGKIANSVGEFVEILDDWYREWKETGSIKYYGDEAKIRFYTRENQTAILAREILKIETKSSG